MILFFAWLGYVFLFFHFLFSIIYIEKFYLSKKIIYDCSICNVDNCYKKFCDKKREELNR